MVLPSTGHAPYYATTPRRPLLSALHWSPQRWTLQYIIAITTCDSHVAYVPGAPWDVRDVTIQLRPRHVTYHIRERGPRATSAGQTHSGRLAEPGLSQSKQQKALHIPASRCLCSSVT